MKIYDIISENAKVDEAFPPVGPVIKAGVQGAKKMLGKTATKATTQTAVGAGKLGTKTLQVIFGGGSKYQQLSNALSFYSLWEPIGECAYKMWGAKTARENGSLTPEQYQGNIQFYLAECSAKLATLLAAKVGAKLAPGLFTRLPFVSGSKLEKLLTNTSDAAASAFLLWFASPQGRKAFADWISGESFSAGFFKNAVGGLLKTGYDKIEAALGVPGAETPPEITQADRDALAKTGYENPKKSDYDWATGQRIQN